MEVKFEMYTEKDPISALMIFDSAKELCASGPILSKVDVEGVSISIKLVGAEIIKNIDPVTKIDIYQIIGIGYIAEPYIIGIDLSSEKDSGMECLTDIQYRSGQSGDVEIRPYNEED